MLVEAEGGDEGADVGGVDDEGEGGAAVAAATAVHPSASTRSNGQARSVKPVEMGVLMEAAPRATTRAPALVVRTTWSTRARAAPTMPPQRP